MNATFHSYNQLKSSYGSEYKHFKVANVNHQVFEMESNFKFKNKPPHH